MIKETVITQARWLRIAVLVSVTLVLLFLLGLLRSPSEAQDEYRHEAQLVRNYHRLLDLAVDGMRGDGKEPITITDDRAGPLQGATIDLDEFGNAFITLESTTYSETGIMRRLHTRAPLAADANGNAIIALQHLGDRWYFYEASVSNHNVQTRDSRQPDFESARIRP